VHAVHDSDAPMQDPYSLLVHGDHTHVNVSVENGRVCTDVVPDTAPPAVYAGIVNVTQLVKPSRNA
jgi:hypothetical protein